MADQGKRLDRETIKRIRYLVGQGKTERATALAVRCSRNTVRKYKIPETAIPAPCVAAQANISSVPTHML
jgi:transposase